MVWQSGMFNLTSLARSLSLSPSMSLIVRIKVLSIMRMDWTHMEPSVPKLENMVPYSPLFQSLRKGSRSNNHSSVGIVAVQSTLAGNSAARQHVEHNLN